DSPRGLRILSAFSPDGAPGNTSLALPRQQRSQLLCDWGLYAKALGDLGTARRASTLAAELDCSALDRAMRLWHSTDSSRDLSVELQNQAGIELLAGRHKMAREAASAALTEAVRAQARPLIMNSYAYLGAALARLGEVDNARLHFRAATELE